MTLQCRTTAPFRSGTTGAPPAMPRDASTPLEGRYADKRWLSTKEFALDWQGGTLYNLHFGEVVGRWRPGGSLSSGICEVGSSSPYC